MSVQDTMVSDKFAFPGAVQWKGVSDLVTTIFGGRLGSGAAHDVDRLVDGDRGDCGARHGGRCASRTRNRFPLSPLAIGLGVVVPPESSLMMFLGSLMFWIAGRIYGKRRESGGFRLWVDSQEAICAGLIAGAALIGIADILVRVFLFDA